MIRTLAGVGFDQPFEADFGVDFGAQQQHHLQKDALQLSDADVVDGAGAELPEELLSTQSSQILDYERPQMEDVVARQPVPFLDHHLTKHFQNNRNVKRKDSFQPKIPRMPGCLPTRDFGLVLVYRDPYHFGAQQLGLDGGAEAARSRPDDEHPDKNVSFIIVSFLLLLPLTWCWCTTCSCRSTCAPPSRRTSSTAPWPSTTSDNSSAWGRRARSGSA
jgi:hypothetical protein